MNAFFEAVRWHPDIGDPTVVGWLLTLAYLACAYMAFRVYAIGNYAFGRMHRKQKRLWLAIACLLIFLAVNKQLDLQSLFIGVMRYLFIKLDLYAVRGQFQLLFVLGLMVATVIALLALLILYHKVIRNHWLALCGMGLLVFYILLRAAEFSHLHLEEWLGAFAVNQLLWLVEATGLGLILLNTLKLVNKGRRRQAANQQS